MTQLSRADIEKLNASFEKAEPQEILRWALETFKGRVGLSSSFGGQSLALIHMAVQIQPDVPILFLNTGFLFMETLQYAAEMTKRFNLNVREFKATRAQIDETRRNLEKRAKEGGTKCCDDAKIDLMRQSLHGLNCWIAGLRRGQGSTRKDIKIIEEYGAGLLKVHPLANWSGKDLYAYMKKHDLPFHPLWEKGFTSIGCEPCTSLPTGTGERSGRWAGLDKSECGIHTFLDKKDKA
ncbi:MAG: phosphoadenylyl-sulfate reductase [Elusimicrobia bacterium]|nr:phosphoadenylyl-sulfate reductase [Elusimicrobiota bacterium]